MELLPSGTIDPHTQNTGLACTLASFMAISKPLIKWPFRLPLGWPGGHQQAWKAEWSPHGDLEAQPQVGSPASKVSLMPASCTTAYTKYLPAGCAAPFETTQRSPFRQLAAATQRFPVLAQGASANTPCSPHSQAETPAGCSQKFSV